MTRAVLGGCAGSGFYILLGLRCGGVVSLAAILNSESVWLIFLAELSCGSILAPIFGSPGVIAADVGRHMFGLQLHYRKAGNLRPKPRIADQRSAISMNWIRKPFSSGLR